MAITADTSAELKRLRQALEAVSEELDALERRPHFSLRHAAENLEDVGSRGIECSVDNFAFALKRSALK